MGYRGRSKAGLKWNDLLGVWVDRKGYQYDQGINSVHRKVYKNTFGKIPKGWVIHHINCNPSDNQPDNLVALPSSFHRRLHGCMRDDRRLYTRSEILEQLKQWVSQEIGDYTRVVSEIVELEAQHGPILRRYMSLKRQKDSILRQTKNLSEDAIAHTQNLDRIYSGNTPLNLLENKQRKEKIKTIRRASDWLKIGVAVTHETLGQGRVLGINTRGGRQVIVQFSDAVKNFPVPTTELQPSS